ncbi:MAG: Asp-tRNA(Asn)/Glu-tRNA(Gln) amidotransferase subunit GatA [Candidatus Moranbacteria bacterium]|nr:Asp-tRNA(Asn)/Glu-tRNA(Gln) amidotransferase subunit GatA [Candidatus Moranbacteria bacterium]
MITELHQKLLNKETTATKLVQQYLDTIKKQEPNINAFLTITEEEAKRCAEVVDKKINDGEEIGLLAGIPCAIKDTIMTKNVRTTAGSKILDNYTAPYDATVMERLKKEDIIMMGKTNMDEFAMGSSTENSAYGPTKNPHDINRVPGGSSGGSAAAVAADEVVWSLGTDTGGSIRQPASFCGVVGLKPTYGRVSRHGLIAMASSLDQVGPFAHSVEDVAIILSAIAGFDPKDATSAKSHQKPYQNYLEENIEGMVVGIPKEYDTDGMDARVKEKYHTAIEDMKKRGAKIENISLPHTKYALPAYYIIMPSEVSSNMARFDGMRYGMQIDDKEGKGLWETYKDTRKYGLGDEVKKRVMLGTYTLSAGYYDAYYKKAQKVRALIKKDFEQAFTKVHTIFTPTSPEVAFPFGAKTDDPITMYLSDIFTVTANIAGVPAISVPIGTVAEEGKELPVGGQIMGKWFDEDRVLKVAHAYELETKK